MTDKADQAAKDGLYATATTAGRLSLDAIEHEIRSLEGGAVAGIVGPCSGMTITGGPDWWTVQVLQATPLDIHWLLWSGPDSGRKIRIEALGQGAEYPAEFLVPVDIAVEVARAFAKTGDLDPRRRWRSDDLGVVIQPEGATPRVVWLAQTS